MIAQVCQQCHAHDSVRYVTFCDACGLEIDGQSVNIDVAGNRQKHFHQKCSPAFEMKCTVCQAVADSNGVVRHDAKLHGDKVPP